MSLFLVPLNFFLHIHERLWEFFSHSLFMFTWLSTWEMKLLTHHNEGVHLAYYIIIKWRKKVARDLLSCRVFYWMWVPSIEHGLLYISNTSPMQIIVVGFIRGLLSFFHSLLFRLFRATLLRSLACCLSHWRTKRVKEEEKKHSKWGCFRLSRLSRLDASSYHVIDLAHSLSANA